jgi:aconitate hydratase
MLAAGLLAKKAVESGLCAKPCVKTSLAPGSRVVSEYLQKTGLQPFLDRLGFQLVGYGCTTCIGNSGPLDRGLEEAILKYDLVVASVLSGNRNFEARIHQSVKASFLMSPPLVVAFAIAGRVDIDLTREPLGVVAGREVHLRDVWPSAQEVGALLESAFIPADYQRVYADFATQNPLWNQIPAGAERLYEWDPRRSTSASRRTSTRRSPRRPSFEISGARAFAIFGDSITTDHISPAGAIKSTSSAGHYLREHGVGDRDFNSYGARRGNPRGDGPWHARQRAHTEPGRPWCGLGGGSNPKRPRLPVPAGVDRLLTALKNAPCRAS